MEITPVPRLADLTRAQQNETLSKEYARYLSVYSQTGLHTSAADHYCELFPRSLGATIIGQQRALLAKTAVAPGTTTDPAWAGALVSPALAAFVELSRAQSLLGRIAGLNVVPFNTKVPTQTADASYSWIAQGGSKPTSRFTFDPGIELAHLKAVGIIVLSLELVKSAQHGNEVAFRDALLNGLVAFTDRSFLDPTSSAIPFTRPASITSGLTAIPSTGDFENDVEVLLDSFFADQPNAVDAVLIANAGNARKLRNLNSGTGPGTRVVATDAAANNVIALNPRQTFVADDGADIKTSDEAMLQMDSAPANPAVPGTTVWTSMFESDLRAFRVERYLNWTTSATAAKYLALA